MPSDDRTRTAQAALERPRDAFRSAVATADEEVRAHRLRRSGGADPAVALAAELGPFAHGRIDAARLASLLAVDEAFDPVTDGLMRTAHDVFRRITAADDEAFTVRVAPGGDLRDTVRDALARLGRAFGVAHAVERARAHRYQPDSDHPLLGTYPFHRWTSREKRLAPPLVIEVPGDDLRAAGLAEFIDGTLKLVLVVEGPTSSAPLARLIAPDAFVAQTSDAGVLAALAAHRGPGVVALVEPDAGAVAFVHDPAAGSRPWERLHLQGGAAALEAGMAAAGPRGSSGDLRHLLELATPPPLDLPATAADRAAGPAADDPADRLAAWLLARTDLQGV